MPKTENKPNGQAAEATEASGQKQSTLKADEFTVWCTFPKSWRSTLKTAAGAMDLPMSKFCRKAVEEAVRKVAAGEQPFATD